MRHITEQLVIADNPGWRFCVAKLGDRWIGYAREGEFTAKKNQAFRAEGLEVEPSGLFLFLEVSEGYQLGMLDREKAIKLTGAVAQDIEQCYGGVERWFVPEELRGNPDEFRCVVCDRIGCDGKDCGHDNYFEDDFEPN